ncbi:MAG: S26 family signal peptidase [Deltaproteobacteria bacterium]|nr:S26 family signal peptidase [Deltaproteobacteria bacterium]
MSAAANNRLGPGAAIVSPAAALAAAGRPRAAGSSPAADLLWCAHIGTSMNPTLAAQDLLEVAPYRDRAVRSGDVILFRAPDAGPLMVHRVLAAGQGAVVTQGDNNRRPDPWPVTREQILGRVVAAWRGDRRRAIAGGNAGEAVGMAMRALNRLDRLARPWLHPLYRGLADLDLLRRLLPARLAPRVIRYRTPGPRREQLLVGQRVIGRFDAAGGSWIIRRPFRLWVGRGPLATPPPTAAADDPPAANC